MSIKNKLLLLLLSISITASLMSGTYSRYVADTTGNVDVFLTKWQILVNTQDITSNSSSSIEITPVIENNENVKAGKFAPSSTGYFDINIDASNVELSYEYEITLAMENENMPDIMISKYAIIDSNLNEGEEPTFNPIVENKIIGTFNFDNNTENFAFDPFTIRVYFEWYEGENEQMNDEDDTLIGIDAENNSFRITASISFKQKIANDIVQEQTPSQEENEEPEVE